MAAWHREEVYLWELIVPAIIYTKFSIFLSVASYAILKNEIQIIFLVSFIASVCAEPFYSYFHVLFFIRSTLNHLYTNTYDYLIEFKLKWYCKISDFSSFSTSQHSSFYFTRPIPSCFFQIFRRMAQPFHSTIVIISIKRKIYI